ncbi:MAG: PEMT/PEM2 family methyltransferase [Dehalococcoidia bacterium]
MRRLFLTIAAFALAAGVNTASVAFQQRSAYLTRKFGRHGWAVHLAVVTPLWVSFLALLPGLGRRVRWPLPARLRPFGTPLFLTAAMLWLLAFRKLGATRTGNGNLFGHGSQEPVSGGIFRLTRNPMYDSYVLAFIAAALRSLNGMYLVLAGAAYVLCHRIEARVENQPLRQRSDLESYCGS